MLNYTTTVKLILYMLIIHLLHTLICFLEIFFEEENIQED